MNHVTLENSAPGMISENCFIPLSGQLDTTGLAINYYERLPGENIGFCYHRHLEQEEVFVVLSGTATFETEDGDIEVGQNEMIRFAPGEWQQGSNRGDQPVSLIAIGAPRDEGATELRRDCPDCGIRRDVTPEEANGTLVYHCTSCGAETGREFY